MAAFLGIPLELIYLTVFVLLIVIYMYWKNAIQGIPEKMMIIRPSGQSSMLKAQSEIGGTFVKAQKMNKEVITVTAKCAPTDVHLGGKQFMRLHFLIEGQGETLDLPSVGKDQEGQEEGKETATHEMLGAFKSILNMLADKAQGGMKRHILPFIAGFGIGGLLILVTERLFGSGAA